MKKKVVIISNDTTNVYNQRQEIIERLIQDEYKVIVISQRLMFDTELTMMGCQLINIKNHRQKKNPFSDFGLFFTIMTELRRVQPDIVLTFNIKPNVYGGLACRLLKIPYISNITGLGTPVEKPGRLQKLTTKLYKLGVSRAKKIFFQNTENLHFFEEHQLLSSYSKFEVIPGSGVNLKDHKLLNYPNSHTTNFLYISRILKEKGIDLVLAAAKSLKNQQKAITFDICGQCDDENYRNILQQYEQEGYIRYHGEQKNLLPYFEKSSCLIHPSYYPEGMSNVLLEAAAHGRPIISTDRSGCRETIDNDITGYIVPINNEEEFIKALIRFTNMPIRERERMGKLGREKMVKEFDRNLIVKAYMSSIESILGLNKELGRMEKGTDEDD